MIGIVEADRDELAIWRTGNRAGGPGTTGKRLRIKRCEPVNPPESPSRVRCPERARRDSRITPPVQETRLLGSQRTVTQQSMPHPIVTAMRESLHARIGLMGEPDGWRHGTLGDEE